MELAAQGVERLLELVHEAAENVPVPGGRLVRAAAEQDPPLVVEDERADRRRRLRVDDQAALAAAHRTVVASELGSATRARNPSVELAHGVRRMTG